jgi:hypothetical protein
MALRAATDTQYEQARIAAQWEIFRNQSMGNELLAASFDSLAGNASNALTGIITGSMSAQEAMQSLASNALNSLINGFVQMGVEWVKSAVMGAAAQTSAIATTAAQTAGLATTTAASTAAATTTMAVGRQLQPSHQSVLSVVLRRSVLLLLLRLWRWLVVLPGSVRTADRYQQALCTR